MILASLEKVFAKLHEHCPECIFIFDFLVKADDKKEADNINLLKSFKAKKLILTADKSNLSVIDDSIYLPSGIYYKKYKTIFTGYQSNVSVMSNPDDINVLKTIID